MPKPQHAILVCTNERPADHPKGSCKPRGGQELLAALKGELKARGLKGTVAVNGATCLKACPFGTVVAVWPEGCYYGGMRPEQAGEVLDSVLAGEVREDWLVPEAEIGMH